VSASHVDLIKPGIPAALKRAGCRGVWVGAEVRIAKILNYPMDKGTKVREIYAAASIYAAGVKITFFLQFGY